MAKLSSFFVVFSRIVVISISLFVFASPTYALGNEFHVSTTGNDSNSGAVGSPVRTFAKAMTLAGAGDTIVVASGTYTERLRVTTSGSAGSPLVVRTNGGAVIDGQNSIGNLIEVPSGTQYVTVAGFEVKNSSGFGVLLSGQNIVLDGVTAHDTESMGIQADGQHITVQNSTVYRASLENESRNASSGWGSGIKCRVGGDDITFRNNTVYNNYGEGIAITRCSNVRVTGNRSYDNFAVNIYIDNSYDVTVDKNFITCSANSGFEKLDGTRPSGITMGEEFYDGWGARLARVMIKNNLITSCNRGVLYFGSDVPNGGLDTVTIANNTLWGSLDTAISLAYEPGKQQNTRVVNNIVQQPQDKVLFIANSTGITVNNNFWVRPSLPSGSGANDKFGDVKLASTPNNTPTSFRLASDSPARDSGEVLASVTDDFEGKARGSQNDMGAIEFEGTSASPSPSPSTSPSVSPSISPSPSVSPSPGNNCRNPRQDVNRDGVVNLLDYAAVVEGMMGNAGDNPNLDVIQDGRINLLDLADVIANLMRQCPQT